METWGGQFPDVKNIYPAISYLITASSSGILKGLILPKISLEHEIVIDYVPGDNIRRFMAGSDRLGHIIIKGNAAFDTVDKLKSYMDDILLNMKVIVR